MSDYHDQLDADVERAEEKVRQTGERVAAHIGRAGRVSGRASSPDGAVSVVVAPGGRLLEVNIDDAVLTMRPEQLAAAVVDVAARATRNAGSRMQQSVRSVVEPPVAESLARLGFAQAAVDEDVDWVAVIRRGR